MDALSLKALHIIFVVTWFAGLFYIVRLFIYQTESADKPEPDKSILVDQFKLMSKRLWLGITWPSAILTALFATWLIVLSPGFLKQGWMHLKLSFVAFLYLYHFACHVIYKQLQNDVYKFTSFQLRVWNELATIFLFAIVFLVVLKDSLSWLQGLAILAVLTVALVAAIKYFKRRRAILAQS